MKCGEQAKVDVAGEVADGGRPRLSSTVADTVGA